MTTEAADPVIDPRKLLDEHHHATEQACTALLARTYADDPQELVAQFRLFEHALLDHLVAEEELLLPAYEKHAPEDARALRDDHEVIRKALYQLAIEVELHVVRAHSVTNLVDSLRAHAQREDTGLYAWASQNLSQVSRRQLFQRIGQSLTSLARFRRRHARGLGVGTTQRTGFSR